MSVNENEEPGGTNHTSDSRSLGALELSRTQRRWFIVFGTVLILLGLATFVGPFSIGQQKIWTISGSDVRGSTLLIAGAIPVILGIIGRLPRGFAFAGIELGFEHKGSTVDALSFVQSAIPDDASADETATIRQMFRQLSSNKADFDLAWDRALESRSEEGQSKPESDDDSWMTEAADGSQISRNSRILTGSKGKPPIVDYLFSSRGSRIAVEEPEYWNPTNTGFLRQRVDRVLSAEGPNKIDLLVITAPKLFMEAALNMVNQLESPRAKSAVVVFQREPGGPKSASRKSLLKALSQAKD